jgi:hypothetical protein
MGYTELHVELWQVQPTDYWKSPVAQGYYDKTRSMVGKKVLDQVMKLDIEEGNSLIKENCCICNRFK